MKRKPLPVQAFELAFAAPQVWAHRVARIWLAGARPSARDRNELWRMSAEKVAAFDESWRAMLNELVRAQRELVFSPLWWLAWMTPERASRRVRAHARRTANAVARAGLAPVHRRAVANARRLGRARRG